MFAEDYIRPHHERWDGSGYPLGPKADQIPLGARVISVADTYDALTSTRVYRPALAEDVARAEMARSAGTQLDPEAVSAFFAHTGWGALTAERPADLNAVAAPALPGRGR